MAQVLDALDCHGDRIRLVVFEPFLVGDAIFIERYGRSAITVSMAIPLGILIAWRWEGIGGAVVIIHAIVEAVVVYYSHVWAGEPYSEGLLTALFATLPFLIAGSLYLGSWWRSRRSGIPQTR